MMGEATRSGGRNLEEGSASKRWADSNSLRLLYIVSEGKRSIGNS